MGTWTDRRLARFASATVTVGVALIAAGLIGLVLPWHVALLSLLFLARPSRDDVRPGTARPGRQVR